MCCNKRAACNIRVAHGHHNSTTPSSKSTSCKPCSCKSCIGSRMKYACASSDKTRHPRKNCTSKSATVAGCSCSTCSPKNTKTKTASCTHNRSSPNCRIAVEAKCNIFCDKKCATKTASDTVKHRCEKKICENKSSEKKCYCSSCNGTEGKPKSCSVATTTHKCNAHGCTKSISCRSRCQKCSCSSCKQSVRNDEKRFFNQCYVKCRENAKAKAKKEEAKKRAACKCGKRWCKICVKLLC